MPSQEVITARINQHLARELKLTEAQRKEIFAVIAQSRGKFEILRRQTEPAVRALISEALQDIRRHLSADQQAVFDRLAEERWKQLNRMPFFTR
jgi:Spy/CpxP family protein refolding chaperone